MAHFAKNKRQTSSLRPRQIHPRTRCSTTAPPKISAFVPDFLGQGEQSLRGMNLEEPRAIPDFLVGFKTYFASGSCRSLRNSPAVSIGTNFTPAAALGITWQFYFFSGKGGAFFPTSTPQVGQHREPRCCCCCSEDYPYFWQMEGHGALSVTQSSA